MTVKKEKKRWHSYDLYSSKKHHNSVHKVKCQALSWPSSKPLNDQNKCLLSRWLRIVEKTRHLFWMPWKLSQHGDQHKHRKEQFHTTHKPYLQCPKHELWDLHHRWNAWLARNEERSQVTKEPAVHLVQSEVWLVTMMLLELHFHTATKRQIATHNYQHLPIIFESCLC